MIKTMLPFRRNLASVDDVVNQFIEENGLEEPDIIKIVLLRYTAPLTNAQLQDLTTTVNVTRQLSQEGIDIFVGAVQFIYKTVEVVSCVNFGQITKVNVAKFPKSID